MSEKRILLASLLKPVNDTRMFEKLGLSLCKLPNVQVHIAGYTAPTPAGLPTNLTLYPIFDFVRLSIGRAYAQIKYWQLLEMLKPDLIIVCTHELLLPSVLYKRKHKCRLIYDVQENYTLNLLSQEHYPWGIKHLLAGGIGTLEKSAAPQTDHFLLAERSYATELGFIDNRFTILENKFKPGTHYTTPPTPVQLRQGSLKLHYTGTIAKLNGVFEAIALAESMYQVNAGTTLTIMGYCASGSTFSKLKEAIADKPYIKLIGGDKLVPHHQILQAISSSDIGLLPYHLNDSIARCIPTKLFEYIASGLPVLVQQNPLWDNLVKKHDAGLSINFNNININNLVTTLLKNKFYQNGVSKDVFWESEEQKLLPLISHML